MKSIKRANGLPGWYCPLKSPSSLAKLPGWGNSFSSINSKYSKVLDTSRGDIIKDFFDPALAVSVRYDRGVGFFQCRMVETGSKGNGGIR